MYVFKSPVKGPAPHFFSESGSAKFKKLQSASNLNKNPNPYPDPGAQKYYNPTKSAALIYTRHYHIVHSPYHDVCTCPAFLA